MLLSIFTYCILFFRFVSACSLDSFASSECQMWARTNECSHNIEFIQISMYFLCRVVSRINDGIAHILIDFYVWTFFITNYVLNTRDEINNNSFLLIVSLRLYLVGKYSVRHEKPSIDNKTQLMEEIISHLKLHCEIFHWIELHQYVLHCRFNYATFITSFEYIWRGCSTHYFAQHTEILKLTSPLSFICWPSMHYVSLFQIPIEPSNTIHNLM